MAACNEPHMKKPTLFRLFFTVFSIWLMSVPNLHAQGTLRPDAITFRTGNIATSFPITGITALFGAPYRPYFEVSASKGFGKKEKQVWEHELNLGYFYHRFMQHGIPLHYNVVRRFEIGKKEMFRAKLGTGYMHSMSAVDRFKLNDDGEYERIRSFGKPQIMFDLGLECSYRFSEKLTGSLQYKTFIQAPFIKSYVPMLPYNSLQLGLSYNLKNTTR